MDLIDLFVIHFDYNVTLEKYVKDLLTSVRKNSLSSKLALTSL